MGDFEQMLNDLCKMSKAQLVQMVKNTDEVEIALNIFKNVMKEDYARVLRCKDCKHYRNQPNGLCYLHTEPKENERGYSGEAVCVEPDDFCSYGERREE
jgi:hypothetical protein